MASSRAAATWVVSSLLSAMFAFAAWAKEADYWGFVEKAVYYRSVSYEWIHIGARATILVEWLLAILLAFGLWLRQFTVPAAGSLLLLFSGLILHAWVAYGLEDCGCLGSLVETPPWIALAKNGVMLSMMWWLAVRGHPHPAGRLRVCAAAVAVAGVAWWTAHRVGTLHPGA